MEEATKQFLELVQERSVELAWYYLSLSEGDVQNAAEMYFDDLDCAETKVSQSEEPHMDKKFTVLEWNIQGLLEYFLSERMQAVIDIIRSHRPTAVLLQEVTPELYVRFQRALRSDYRGFCPASSFEVFGNYFCAIFVDTTIFRFDAVKETTFFTSKQGRQALSVQGHCHGQEFVLITAHLEGMKSEEFERKKQLATVFDIMKQTPQNCCVVFGGDTNLRDSEFKSLVDSGRFDTKIIDDVWTMLGSPQDTRYSWDLQKNDNQIKGGMARLRFERLYTRVEKSTSKNVFKPKDMKFVGCDRLQCGKFPSDHWGILVSFSA